MILIISDNPTTWAESLLRHLQNKGISCMCSSTKELMQAYWQVSTHPKLKILCQFIGTFKPQYCKAVIFTKSKFNWLPSSIEPDDYNYFQSAWLSLFDTLKYSNIPIYNPLNILGNDIQWQYIYQMAQNLGIEHIADANNYFNHDYFIAMARAWQQCETRSHNSFLNLVCTNKWIYIHYLDKQTFYVSYYNKNLSKGCIPLKYIKLGYKLLEQINCKMGMVLFNIDSNIKFVSLSSEPNWEYCYEPIATINNYFVTLPQSNNSNFKIISGEIPQIKGLTIASHLRPKLQGGYIQETID